MCVCVRLDGITDNDGTVVCALCDVCVTARAKAHKRHIDLVCMFVYLCHVYTETMRTNSLLWRMEQESEVADMELYININRLK